MRAPCQYRAATANLYEPAVVRMAHSGIVELRFASWSSSIPNEIWGRPFQTPSGESPGDLSPRASHQPAIRQPFAALPRVYLEPPRDGHLVRPSARMAQAIFLSVMGKPPLL